MKRVLILTALFCLLLAHAAIPASKPDAKAGWPWWLPFPPPGGPVVTPAPGPEEPALHGPGGPAPHGPGRMPVPSWPPTSPAPHGPPSEPSWTPAVPAPNWPPSPPPPRWTPPPPPAPAPYWTPVPAPPAPIHREPVRHQRWEKRELALEIARRLMARCGGDYPLVSDEPDPDVFSVQANGPSGHLWFTVRFVEYTDSFLPWHTSLSFSGWGNGTGRTDAYGARWPGGDFSFSGCKPHHSELQFNLFPSYERQSVTVIVESAPYPAYPAPAGCDAYLPLVPAPPNFTPYNFQ